MIRERQLGEVTVFYCCRRFASQHYAKSMWEHLERKLAGKGLDLATYRHGSSSLPGTTVTALSLEREGVEKADWYLRRGSDVDPYDDPHVSLEEIDALIARRADFVVNVQAPSGEPHARFRYGPQGKRLRPDGSYE